MLLVLCASTVILIGFSTVSSAPSGSVDSITSTLASPAGTLSVQ